MLSSQPDPKPPFIVSPLIREQYFGEAEGNPWTYKREKSLSLEEHFAKGIYPVLFGADEHFPGGESMNMVAVRAGQAIDELVMPRVWRAVKEGKKSVHIALVSHGLCISQLILQLLKKGTEFTDGDYKGLQNTAWTRVTVDVKVSPRP